MSTRTLALSFSVIAFALTCPSARTQTSPAEPTPPHQAQTTVPATSPSFNSLATQISALVSDSAVSRDHWGIYVTGLDGTLIYGLNQNQLFQPASNAKLFTTSAALALLGPNATFTTTVSTQGTIANGQLKGDLVLLGDGDPNLSGRQLPYTAPTRDAQPATLLPPPDPLRFINDLADQVAATGLKSIDGSVLGDDTLFPWEPYPNDWTIDDAVWAYGAPVSALSINDNRIELTITPGILPKELPAHAVGETPAAITASPDLPYYTIQNEVITVDPKSKWSIDVDRAPGSHTVRVHGTIAADATPDIEDIAIDDPAAYAAMALKQALVARGITVSGDAHAWHRTPADAPGFQEQAHRPIPYLGQSSTGTIEPCFRCGHRTGPGPVLAKHVSYPLLEDIVLTNKVSQNLHAELLLHQLSVSFSDDPNAGSTAQGARVVRQFLLNAGVDPDDFVFYDGSGLSGHDLVTPRATARLLQFAATQPWFAEWKSSLPIGGEDGSLGGRFGKPPLKDHVFAKTGTLGEARALSGYLDCATGHTVIFSIMVDNHPPGSDSDRKVMDQIVAAIQAAE